MLHLVLPLFPKHVTNKTEDLYWLIIATGRVGQTYQAKRCTNIHSSILSLCLAQQHWIGVSPITKYFSFIVHATQYNCHARLFGTSCFHRHVSSRFWNELFNLTKDKVGVLYSLEGLNSDRTVLPSWRDLYQGLLRGIGCVASSLRDYLRRGLLCLLPPICDHLLIYTIF